MITLTEEERSFLFTEINTLYQNWNYRSIEGELLKSILDKSQSTVILFNEVESRRIQIMLRSHSEGLAPLSNQRLQHILQTQNNQGFLKSSSPFFHAGKQFQLCQSIINKLMGS